MPPKLIRLSTLTRSQSREQGLDFTWSRQLGGSVEITTKEIEQDSQAGQHEDPADKLSNTSVAIEIAPTGQDAEKRKIKEVILAWSGIIILT